MISNYSSKMETISPSKMRFMFFTAQKLPHMLHVSSFSGGRIRGSGAPFGVDCEVKHRVPVKLLSGNCHFVVPIHRVRNALCDVSRVRCNACRDDALLHIVHIRQAQVLWRA